jgi:hypothetical protein
MAKAAGVSHTMVGRIWRTFRLQPHRTESFKLSPDPQLVEKIRDVVGLYVAPPANAVVFAGREIPDPSAATRSPSCRWTSASPSAAPTTMCAMGRWISSPRSMSRPVPSDATIM